MNKCNGTERNGRKDGFFARKACSVCVCSDPLFSISFHFIPFHSVPFHFLSGKTERNGAERREGGREGEKVKNYFYITWKNGAEWNGTERRQGEREGVE